MLSTSTWLRLESKAVRRGSESERESCGLGCGTLRRERADGEEKINKPPVALAQPVVPCYHDITVSATSDRCRATSSSLTGHPLPPLSPASAHTPQS